MYNVYIHGQMHKRKIHRETGRDSQTVRLPHTEILLMVYDANADQRTHAYYYVFVCVCGCAANNRIIRGRGF